LLVILINKATKLFNYFLTLDKEYVAAIKLGVITDTWDLKGKILFTKKVDNIDAKEVLAAIDKFRGEIRQVPPVYSSVKYRGKPSYNYARKGLSIDLKPKIVNIYNLELVSLKNDLITIRISCSSGTYVRSLAYEIGNFLGLGAAIKRLKRIRIGNYKIEDSIEVEEFLKYKPEKSYLETRPYMISIERLLDKSEELYIKSEYSSYITNGLPVTIRMIESSRTGNLGLLKEGSFVKIRDNNENLLAVHQILAKEVSGIKDKNLKLTKSIIVF